MLNRDFNSVSYRAKKDSFAGIAVEFLVMGAALSGMLAFFSFLVK
jgi:hypothetical protein